MAEAAAMAGSSGGITSVATEEAQSVLATFVGQVLGIVRSLINAALTYIGDFIRWSGENPKAASIFMMNMFIMFT